MRKRRNATSRREEDKEEVNKTNGREYNIQPYIFNPRLQQPSRIEQHRGSPSPRTIHTATTASQTPMSMSITDVAEVGDAKTNQDTIPSPRI